jgi:hypothetical protein
MGLIFSKKGRIDDTAAFYEKVISIWGMRWTPQLALGNFIKIINFS